MPPTFVPPMTHRRSHDPNDLARRSRNTHLSIPMLATAGTIYSHDYKTSPRRPRSAARLGADVLAWSAICVFATALVLVLL